jgi:hypothetical protein
MILHTFNVFFIPEFLGIFPLGLLIRSPLMARNDFAQWYNGYHVQDPRLKEKKISMS